LEEVGHEDFEMLFGGEEGVLGEDVGALEGVGLEAEYVVDCDDSFVCYSRFLFADAVCFHSINGNVVSLGIILSLDRPFELVINSLVVIFNGSFPIRSPVLGCHGVDNGNI